MDGGFGYVWERLFGGDTDGFPAAAFGAEHDWKLRFGASWHSRVDYTPSLSAWASDDLLRGETSLLFPFTDALSFKVSFVGLYDSSPAEDTDRGSLTSLVGLALGCARRRPGRSSGAGRPASVRRTTLERVPAQPRHVPITRGWRGRQAAKSET